MNYQSTVINQLIDQLLENINRMLKGIIWNFKQKGSKNIQENFL